MRGMMLAVVMAFLAGSALAGVGDSAIGNETPTAEGAPDKAKSEAMDNAQAPEPFKVPAGYQVKKRGDKVAQDHIEATPVLRRTGTVSMP